MKKQGGFSLIVLVITIIIILILVGIVINPATTVLDETENSKEVAETRIDNEKIDEIITYELSESPELIDLEIDMKRLELSDSLKIKNNDIVYGEGWTLYICERDIPQIVRKTGKKDFYKPYKEITKSYVVNTETGEYVRLEYKWKFVD